MKIKKATIIFEALSLGVGHLGGGLGALYGYVPESFFTENLGTGEWWLFLYLF